jgi:hypothetical protein
LKDVDPRVFTRIVTDGRSVPISPRNFVGEGIIKYIDKNHAIPIKFIQSTKCQISLKWQLPIEKRKINKHVISVLSVLFIMYNCCVNKYMY